MKIYIDHFARYSDEKNIYIKHDLELTCEKHDDFTDFMYLIQRELYIRNRNIFVKIVDKSYRVTNENKLVEYDLMEVSNKPFEREYEEDCFRVVEYEVPDIIFLSEHDDYRDYNEYIYINPKTQVEFNVQGFITKKIESRFFKLVPLSNWYVNDKQWVTICFDCLSEERKAFYSNVYDKGELSEALNKVFEYIENNQNKFYEQFVLSNTSESRSVLKDDIHNFYHAFF